MKLFIIDRAGRAMNKGLTTRANRRSIGFKEERVQARQPRGSSRGKEER